MPLLALSGLLVALAIIKLPGTGGHSPADGFTPAGALAPAELPGVLLAALATLSFGVVLGPEAPLILMGSGLGVLAVHLAARDAPAQASTVMSAAGSFAAISSLLGSPIIGAFLLLETAGLGGPMLGGVLVPGLLAAGVGTLIFVGLDALTGFGTFSLTLPGLPPFDRPTVLGRRREPVPLPACKQPRPLGILRYERSDESNLRREGLRDSLDESLEEPFSDHAGRFLRDEPQQILAARSAGLRSVRGPCLAHCRDATRGRGSGARRSRVTWGPFRLIGP